MTLIRFAPLALLFLATPTLAHEGMLHDGCAAGQTFAAGDLTVSGAFSRATLEGARVGAGYMTITNAGATPDRLVSATSEVTPNVQLHSMTVKDGMMTMAELPDGIDVPANGSVTLEPGGLHMMFMGPNQPFKEGECIAVTLTFENAGELPIELTVGPIGADAPPMEMDHAM